MKKLLFVAFIIGATFLSCSKKNNPKPTGTFNGSNYSPVIIGTQTWTSVNYNGPNGVNYNGGANDPVYGKLYTLAEAKAIALPAGWHLPTEADVETLLHYLGATGTGTTADATISSKLKSISDWQFNVNGSNSSGFNAYPAGDEWLGTYEALNQETFFWTNSADNSYGQYVLDIYDYGSSNNFAIIYRMPAPSVYDNNTRISVRFVKDN